MGKKHLIIGLVLIISISVLVGYVCGSNFPQLSKQYLAWQDYREGYAEALSENHDYQSGYERGYSDGYSISDSRFTPANLTINTQPVNINYLEPFQTYIVFSYDDKPLMELNGDGSYYLLNTTIFHIILEEGKEARFYPMLDNKGNTYFNISTWDSFTRIDGLIGRSKKEQFK